MSASGSAFCTCGTLLRITTNGDGGLVEAPHDCKPAEIQTWVRPRTAKVHKTRPPAVRNSEAESSEQVPLCWLLERTPIVQHARYVSEARAIAFDKKPPHLAMERLHEVAPDGLHPSVLAEVWQDVRRGRLFIPEKVRRDQVLRWAENFLRDKESPDTIADRYEVSVAKVRSVLREIAAYLVMRRWAWDLQASGKATETASTTVEGEVKDA